MPRLVGQGRHTAKAVVWPLLVIFWDPQFGDFAYLLEGIEQVCIQHLLAIGAIESLDKGVLVRLARLDVEQLDLLFFTSLSIRKR